MTCANIVVAQTYGRFGVPVFPCREAGERAKSPYLAKGYHQAEADPHVLWAWAGMYPNALYGLPCAPNRLFVLDADRHGSGDGVANIMALFAWSNFDWQSVPVVKTPRDGLHFIFQKQGGLGKTRGKIAEAVDVRDNGYIIAPGNTLPDGRQYQLVNGTVEQLARAIKDCTLPLMPTWLIERAIPPARTPPLFIAPLNGERAENQLRGLIRAIVNTPPGSRNQVLFWAACRFGGLARHGVVSPQASFAILLESGRRAGLGESETQKTTLSGLRKGYEDAADGR